MRLKFKGDKNNNNEWVWASEGDYNINIVVFDKINIELVLFFF